MAVALGIYGRHTIWVLPGDADKGKELKLSTIMTWIDVKNINQEE